MDIWTIHWLESDASIKPWREAIESEIRAAQTLIAKHLDLPLLDVLVQRIEGYDGIPEIGMVGHAYRRSCLSITVAPDNENFAVALAGGALQRTVAHEVNHCLRMAGPGYGRTLGEALVSEGLAGHFTQFVLGSDAQPWDVAFPHKTLVQHFPSADLLASKRYDHAAWFFGKGKNPLPRWFGYSLGYAIVAEWLASVPRDVNNLIGTPAATILTAAVRKFTPAAN